MRAFLILAIMTFLATCTVTEKNQPSEVLTQFEDGSTGLLSVIDCSNIGGPEYERNCLEQVYENRNTLESSSNPQN